jgi:ATP-binding cassette subfamily F protein 3
METRQKELERLEALPNGRRRRIAKEMEFVERFRYKATKARQAQSRLKMLLR